MVRSWGKFPREDLPSLYIISPTLLAKVMATKKAVFTDGRSSKQVAICSKSRCIGAVRTRFESHRASLVLEDFLHWQVEDNRLTLKVCGKLQQLLGTVA